LSVSFVVGPCQVYGDKQQAAHERDRRNVERSLRQAVVAAVPLTVRPSRRQVSVTFVQLQLRHRRRRHKVVRSELAALTPSRQCWCPSLRRSGERMIAWSSGGGSSTSVASAAPSARTLRHEPDLSIPKPPTVATIPPTGGNLDGGSLSAGSNVNLS
jgi:hypothetical protein